MVDKITKKLKLKTRKISPDLQDEFKQEVGDFVVNEILRATSQGKSPVEGERFKKLSREYAEREKQGNRTPNLRLEGDMLEALRYEPIDDGIEIGVFGETEAEKADGHNKFTGRKSNNPKRRFIPTTKQKFNKGIQQGIDQIQREYERASEREASGAPSILSTAGAITETETASLREILGSNFFRDLLNG